MLIAYFIIIGAISHHINDVKSAPTNPRQSVDTNIVFRRSREVEHVGELIPKDVDLTASEGLSSSSNYTATAESSGNATSNGSSQAPEIAVLPWEESDLEIIKNFDRFPNTSTAQPTHVIPLQSGNLRNFIVTAKWQNRTLKQSINNTIFALDTTNLTTQPATGEFNTTEPQILPWEEFDPGVEENEKNTSNLGPVFSPSSTPTSTQNLTSLIPSQTSDFSSIGPGTDQTDDCLILPWEVFDPGYLKNESTTRRPPTTAPAMGFSEFEITEATPLPVMNGSAFQEPEILPWEEWDPMRVTASDLATNLPAKTTELITPISHTSPSSGVFSVTPVGLLPWEEFNSQNTIFSTTETSKVTSSDFNYSPEPVMTTEKAEFTFTDHTFDYQGIHSTVPTLARPEPVPSESANSESSNLILPWEEFNSNIFSPPPGSPPLQPSPWVKPTDPPFFQNWPLIQVPIFQLIPSNYYPKADLDWPRFPPRLQFRA